MTSAPASTPSAPDAPRFVPLAHAPPADDAELLARGRAFHALLDARRTTRHFAATPVPREAVELAIRCAGTAPSGAHQQPWTFVAVGDPAVKARIRAAAEAEERLNYGGRMGAEWLEALAPFGTDAVKPHLTDAPWVVVAFRQVHGVRPDGTRRAHYYTQESVGIAVGLFVAAVHAMGLVTLTHTPNPMGFLGELLGRPAHERAFLVMPVGHPAPGALVPDLRRKALEEIAAFV